MKRTTREYRNLMMAATAMKIAAAEDEGPYRVSKWTDEEVTNALNEGYVAGLKESLRMLEVSEFLLED